jgi:subtilisin family serine protease
MLGRNRAVTRALAVATAVIVATIAGPAAAGPERDARPAIAAPDDDLVLVKPEGDGPAPGALAALGLAVERPIGRSGWYVVRTRPGGAADAHARLGQLPGIAAVERNHVRTAAAAPNDPHYQSGRQNAFEHARLEPAWDLAPAHGRGARVALLDTGVAPVAGDLLPDTSPLTVRVAPGFNVLAEGYSLSCDGYGTDAFNTTDTDPARHGTRLATLVAGNSDNNLGGAGVAENATIVPVKVAETSDFATSTSDLEIADGIYWAVDCGNVDVISISWAGPDDTLLFDEAVQYARDAGVVVVAAAGNDGSTTEQFPAASVGAIGVGALDRHNRVAAFSNRGVWLSLVAPGVDVLTTGDYSSYAPSSGTSFATAIVAGTAALVHAQTGLSGAALEERLLGTSRDFGPVGHDRRYGFGALDAAGAVLGGAPPSQATISTDVTPNDLYDNWEELDTVTGVRTVNGTLTPEDSDWYRFKTPTSTTYEWRFTVELPTGSPVRPRLELWTTPSSNPAPQAQRIASDLASAPGASDASFTIALPAAASSGYRVAVRDAAEHAVTGAYTLRIEQLGTGTANIPFDYSARPWAREVTAGATKVRNNATVAGASTVTVAFGRANALAGTSPGRFLYDFQDEFAFRADLVDRSGKVHAAWDYINADISDTFDWTWGVWDFEDVVTGMIFKPVGSLPAGAYTIRIRNLEDYDGDILPFWSYNFVVGSAPAQAPTVTITSAPPPVTGSADAHIEFTADKAGVLFQCRLDAGPWTTCTSPYHAVAGGGHHGFAVRAVDLAVGASAPATVNWQSTSSTTTTTSTSTTTTAPTTTTTKPPSTTTTTKPPPAPKPVGYWMVDSVGNVYAFGQVSSLGRAPSAGIVDIEPTADGKGYWVLNSAGVVYAFGNAKHHGNGGGLPAGEFYTAMSATPNGGGYWLFTNRGRAVRFGNAVHRGDMSGVTLNGPVLGSIATPTGNGYYMVASDGGIFAFGDAKFYGSMGGRPLNKPVNGLVPTSDGRGYWLVASDGGIFAFGNAPFRGSMGGVALNKPVIGMVRYGNGYLMVGSDGGIFNFSNKAFFGSLGDNPPPTPIVAVAAIG